MSDLDATAGARYARLAETPMRHVGDIGKFTPAGVARSIREVVSHRELLNLLIRRDLKARYKDSALGFLWVLARPLVMLAIYVVVLGQFLGAARGIPDFAIFVFTGITAMGLFQEIAVGGTGSVLANAGLVKKVYVPRELFPLASVGSALFNFLIQLVVLIVATLVFSALPLHWEMLYAIPSLLIMVLYGLVFALLFGALNVYLRDIQYLVEVATMILFWASPVLYSWQLMTSIVQSPVLQALYTANPLTLAVMGFQRAFWMAGDTQVWPPHLLLMIMIAVVVGFVLVLICHRVFLRLQGNFAQEL